ncbi:MAG TPA: bifunctional UDP-N-acetylglucosamine diphosphorylase/glucosamine-1-phosphate N-acetyltransferase GlmU [Thermoanaerobaculia bacterium]|nr:bifunctional UDP-N-acetylglucosamine diphosphorylase/glucosamine-1-phosphate N-acetyltransferase GlmU [Thermoanaerobaculia bacterium]
MPGPVTVVLLAAGRGVRMKSARPKVLHEAAGRPLIDHVVGTARAFLEGRPGSRLVVVAGAGREELIPHLARTAPEAIVVVQDPPRGTGDAVRAALPALGDATRVVVLAGDVPLLSASVLVRLEGALDVDTGAGFAVLTARLGDAGAYGRVVRDGNGRFARIVEARDATPEELSIGEINSGIYAFERAVLERELPRLTDDNAQREFYLTDVLGLAVAEGIRGVAIPVEDASEVLGVNSRAELAEVDALLRGRATRAAMVAGATLIRPETITLDEGVTFGPDTVVEPFVTITGPSSIGALSRIGQGCVVASSTIGANVVVRPYCVIENAVVGDGAVVGPFARLREGTVLGPEVHVGNFVETKKALLARGAKANHLTYLGDCSVGEKTNVGAGVITCNYDGFGKHHTGIGAGVFVGSDVQLVAPVTIGDGAVIGAGSTITKDVPAHALATSRVPQKTIEGGGARYRERKAAEKSKKE